MSIVYPSLLFIVQCHRIGFCVHGTAACCLLKIILWPSWETMSLYDVWTVTTLTTAVLEGNWSPFWNPSGFLWKILNIFHGGMTRVSTSSRYVPGHSLTPSFFGWLRPEAIYLFDGSVSCSWNGVDGSSEGECRLPRCENPPYVFAWQLLCFCFTWKGKRR